MKTFIVSLLLLFSIIIARGQSPQIDSLNTLLRNSVREDTNKVNTLTALCGELLKFRKYDTVLIIAKETQVLSEKIHYKKGIGTALLTSAVCNYNLGNYSTTEDNGLKALALFQEINNKKGIVSALSKLGATYSQLCNYTKSLGYLFKALVINEELDDKKSITYNLTNIGLNYYYLGNYSEALEYHFKALTICKEINDEKGLASVLEDIGSDYGSQEDLSNALKYYTQSLQISEKIGERNSSAHDLINIGNIYFEQGNDSVALTYFFKALNIFQDIKYNIGITLCLLDIGNTYKKEGKNSAAWENDYKALVLSRKIDYKRTIAKCYIELGRLDILKKNYKEAKIYFDSSLVISKNIEVKDIIQDAYRGLFQLDSAIANYKEALGNFKKYIAFKDSIVNEANQKKIVQAEMNYEFEQKQASAKAEQDKKDAIRNAEEIKQTAEYKTQKIITILIASIAVILILLVIVIFQRMRGAEKEKLMVEQQKSWLELKALRTQMNPHFLYNTINSIQSYVLKNDTKSSVNYLAQFASLMRGVLENSRKDKITLSDEVEGLFNYLDFETMRFPSKFKYQIKIDNHLDKNKTLLPPLLIQPYVENAIWHGLMHMQDGIGQVTIIFEKIDGHIMCVIDDNGIGRKAAKELRNKLLHKPHGMSIVAERMESMNRMYHWDMKVHVIDKVNEDEVSTGTRVELYLPLILNTVLYD